ncbi:MAG TPA: metal/formaldehyde-sensitive transcriptional repressor [Oceanipulchritudo sp.]|nr:metal/formaldehyde-sensitive transcriptional repressor [Oceanipulchritudo sp.]
MPHLTGDNTKLIQRVRRLRGQLEGVERMLVDGKNCYDILQGVAACRGALNGLTKEMMLAHIDHHLLQTPESPETVRASAVELRSIIESYLK